MKGLIAFAAAVLWGATASADCADPFGKPNELLEFHVRMKRADWNSLLRDTVPDTNNAATLNPQDCHADYPRYRAEFRCGNEAWMPVAVHKKRGTERGVEVPSKPPLRIDFNEDFMGQVPQARRQSWPAAMGALGYRKLTLSNGQMNKPPVTFAPRFLAPVLLNEYAGLRLLERELPLAAKAAYARVYLHFEDKPDGEYHGAYLIIEDFDRIAIRRRVGEALDRGRLAKKTNPNCPEDVKYDDGPPNPAYAAYVEWAAKDPEASPATWMKDTEKAIHLDTLLRQEAIREILFNGYDTITHAGTPKGPGNNYWTFDPRAGSARLYIPWDVDQVFGSLYGICGAAAYFACTPNKPVLERCEPDTMYPASKEGLMTLCRPGIKERYLQIMCQLVNGSLSPGEFNKLWDEADRTVRPAVMDEGPLWREDFVQRVRVPADGGADGATVAVDIPLPPPDGGADPLREDLFKTYAYEYKRMKEWMKMRTDFVRAEINRLGVSCKAACTEGETEKCELLTCGGARRCEKGLWTPCRLDAACLKNLTAPPDGGAPGGDGGAQAATKPASPGCSCTLGAHRGTPVGGLAAALLALAAVVARFSGRRGAEAASRGRRSGGRSPACALARGVAHRR